MIYLLICLSLSLAGITGLQFFYLAYLDRLDKDQKRRIKELEKHCQLLTKQLATAESSVADYPDSPAEGEILELTEEDDNEVWADVIGEA